MKNAIGGNMLFMLVIFFVLLFAGYLCLSINHSRAFNVKDSIVRIVERYANGKKDVMNFADDESFKNEISAILNEAGYALTGDCNTDGETDWEGFNVAGELTDASNATFCIRRVLGQSEENSFKQNNRMAYYQIKTFYHLEIPIIKSIFNLTVKGDTKAYMLTK